MTEKEMKRLSRAELLELLLERTKEAERLQEKLEKAESMLMDRYLRIQEAGDLAQAVLVINGVMEAAQASAKQYLDNIRIMEDETKKKCEEMLSAAREEAELIRNSTPESINAEMPDDLNKNSGQPLKTGFRSDGEKFWLKICTKNRRNTGCISRFLKAKVGAKKLPLGRKGVF